MSEDSDTNNVNENTNDKQEQLKQKLKDMGLMSEDGHLPARKQTSFFRSKWFLLIVIIAVVGFWYWVSEKDSSEHKAGTNSGSGDRLSLNNPNAMHPPQNPYFHPLPHAQTDQANMHERFAPPPDPYFHPLPPPGTADINTAKDKESSRGDNQSTENNAEIMTAQRYPYPAHPAYPPHWSPPAYYRPPPPPVFYGMPYFPPPYYGRPYYPAYPTPYSPPYPPR